MANKIRGLTIQINGETKGLNKALNEVNTQSKSLQKELKEVEKALKIDPGNTELLRQKQTLLAQSVEATRTKLDALRQAQDQMAKANAANARWEDAYKPLKAEIEATNASLKKLAAQESDMKSQLDSGKISTEQYEKFQKALNDTTAKSKELSKQAKDLEAQFENGHISDEEYRKFQRELSNTTKELKDAEKQADAFTKSIDTLGGKINDVDTRLNGGITKGIEKLGAASAVAAGVAIKKYVDFGKETQKLSTLLDTSVLSMDGARKAILKFSDDTGQAAADVAGAMYDALSSGVKTEDSIRFMAQATQTATAGFSNTATTVDILTTILNSYGMKVSDVAKISDQLLLTQDKGKVTVGELANGLGDLVGLASSAGVSFEDLLAAIATLTSNGLDSGSAITSLKAAISNMVNPAEQARAQANRLGFSFNSQMLEANGLNGMLSILKSTVGGNTAQMAKLFGSTEALNAMLILSGEGNALYTDTLREMNQSAGKTVEVFNTVQGDPTKGFTDSVNKMNNSLIELGISLTPLIKALTGFFTIVGSIPAPVLIVIGSLFSMAAILLQVIKGVGLLTSLGGGIGKFFGGWNVAALKTTAIILGVVAALVALGVIIATIIGKGPELMNSMKGIGDSVSKITSNGMQATPQQIPGWASGTNFHPGGLALVGEQGAELVSLPRGTRVYNNGETRKILSEQGSSGGDTFQINVNVENLKDVEQLLKIARDARRMERMGTVKG